MSAKRLPVVAVVGATGAVGAELIGCLETRDFPLSELKLFASARSAGKTLPFKGKQIPVQELTENSFAGVDIGLFSAGGAQSKKYAPHAVKAGTVVIDNSSAFRMDPDVPLIIPEINARRIQEHKGIIANPNCSAITAITPLWPIHRKNRIQRMILSTYQAASGAGAAAMKELEDSTRAYLAGQPFENKVLPHPYAFNLFNHNTAVDPVTGYNDEETKVMKETKKIFEDQDVAVTVTCVRVPVLRAHCIAMSITCEKPINRQEVLDILIDAPGVRIVDDWANNYFPMPKDASGQGDVLVGRIRQDLSDPSGRSMMLFTSADQLLKGAALNAVQIAELL